MPGLLIRTKLHPLITRADLVARPRLQEKLAEGLRGPLTLVTAPAGFGKTTLVASCLTTSATSATSAISAISAGPGGTLRVAWLSLDRNDNDPARFLTYLIAALQEGDARIGVGAAQMLAPSGRQVPIEPILIRLINDLDARVGNGDGIALVFDDYQFISSAVVHDAVAFLLERCPASLHVVISTRSDPPLSLARLRARGQAVEMRAADLSFTEGEATRFLNDLMGLHLDARLVAALRERTEGWIAGLQMAALSMRDREDVEGFIKGFTGTNRYILDYLLEEVMSGQPPHVQHFLLQTSILERLSAPLCDAVLDAHDSASTLEYLERANLFLLPLDDERHWFRYHHLFAELLITQLRKTLESEGVARLHLRASEWYEQNDLPLDAIQHAALASDLERIERLIAENYLQMLNRGEASQVSAWMGKLSRELIYERPWLCLYEAFSRSWFGQLEEANLLLDYAEKEIQTAHSPAVDVEVMLGYHNYVKSRVTAMQGDNLRAIELCRAARSKAPPGKLSLHVEMAITLGYEYFLHGDFASARDTLGEMMRLCGSVGAINNPVAAYALLARMATIEGRLHDADALYEKAAQLIRSSNEQHRGVTGLVETGTGALLCEWGDLDAAIVRVKRSLELVPLWGKADDLILACTTLARIESARGEWEEAAQALKRATEVARSSALFSEARAELEAAQTRLWLAQGERRAFERWSAAQQERRGSAGLLRFEDEPAHIAQARGFIALSEPDGAKRLLHLLEGAARPAGRWGRLIEILILKALAMQALGEAGGASTAIAESLALAEPEGYRRVYLDEGRPMQLLLSEWLSRSDAQATAGPLREYASALLSQFDVEQHAVTAVRERASKSTSTELAEPLTGRELEVLGLIALGRTNVEVARELVISPGTVKAHTAAIYGKLGAANRTEAVARARQMGILP